MMIFIIKFLHLLVALSLIAGTVYCLAAPHSSASVRKKLLWLSVFALMTGSMLVPVHFNFHTPWIIAAYVLLTLFCFIILILKKITLAVWAERVIYLGLVSILLMIIHDAVTKHTISG